MRASVELTAGAEPFPGYRLRRARGRGGFAEVWEASAPDGSLVALKFMTLADSISAAREVRSISAIRTLHHKGLIRIDQVWSPAGAVVIAMELADGSLADLHDAYCAEYGTTIPPDQLCFYLSQTAEALDFLNARRHDIDGRRVAIQHCDVKPSNLMLVGDSIKLADFGLAAVLSSGPTSRPRCGTMEYAPPEVWQGRLSERGDQFSLAVTYHQLRTGLLPFPPPPTTFRADYARPAPDLDRLSAGEQAALRRALSVAPQSRWPSCSDLMRALSEACRAGSSPGSRAGGMASRAAP